MAITSLKDPNNRALGPKYYNSFGICVLQPYYLDPWTLRTMKQCVDVVVCCGQRVSSVGVNSLPPPPPRPGTCYKLTSQNSQNIKMFPIVNLMHSGQVS